MRYHIGASDGRGDEVSEAETSEPAPPLKEELNTITKQFVEMGTRFEKTLTEHGKAIKTLQTGAVPNGKSAQGGAKSSLNPMAMGVGEPALLSLSYCVQVVWSSGLLGFTRVCH